MLIYYRGGFRDWSIILQYRAFWEKEIIGMRTLLLDSTYYPVRVVNWQKAMILWLTGRAEIVDVYSDIDIRSPSDSFKLPKTLRLYNRHRYRKGVRFCRFNVFFRDNFSCQYCGQKGGAKELTLDHLIPQSRGGRATWQNIVTACHTCNSKKGNRLPHEVGMSLRKRPRRPRWTPHLVLRLKKGDPEEWWEWFPRVEKGIKDAV